MFHDALESTATGFEAFCEEKINAFDEDSPFWDFKLWCVIKNNSPKNFIERKSLQGNVTAFGTDLGCFYLNTDLQ